MDMRHHLFIGARLAVEGQDDEPPRIERRENGGGDAGSKGVMAQTGRCRKGGFEDDVLGEKAREKRHAGQRQAADPHQQISERDGFPDAAHLAHVLLVGHGVNHRAGAEEEKRLEEGVRGQMEHAGRIGRYAAGKEHVAELATGRIRDHPLDIVLRDGDGGGEYRRGSADEGDDGKGDRRIFEQRRAARHQENSGRYHGRCMDESGNRRRAFHRVRQPSVEKELRRFPHSADEEQNADDGQDVEVMAEKIELRAGQIRRRGKHRVETDRVEGEINRQYAEAKAEISDPVDDERLNRRRIGGGALIPKAD